MKIQLGKNYQCIVPAKELENMEEDSNILFNIFPYGLPVRITKRSPNTCDQHALFMSWHGIEAAQKKAIRKESYWNDQEEIDVMRLDSIAIAIPNTRDQFRVFHGTPDRSKMLTSEQMNLVRTLWELAQGRIDQIYKTGNVEQEKAAIEDWMRKVFPYEADNWIRAQTSKGPVNPDGTTSDKG